MKVLRFICIFALCTGILLTVKLNAALADEKTLIRDAVLKLVDVTYKQIDSPMIKKIFNATFYSVTIRIQKGGSESSEDMMLVRVNDRIFTPEDTSTTKSMPLFLSTIRKNFKMNNDEDAAIFENALDSLFPIGSFGNDQKVKAVRRTDKTVTFIRGDFFGKLKGFIITLNADNTISDIKYSLEIQ